MPVKHARWSSHGHVDRANVSQSAGSSSPDLQPEGDRTLAPSLRGDERERGEEARQVVGDVIDVGRRV